MVHVDLSIQVLLTHSTKHTWVHSQATYPSLVGGIPTPLKNMSSSVGMMVIPNWMESHKIHVPNHQPVPEYSFHFSDFSHLPLSAAALSMNRATL